MNLTVVSHQIDGKRKRSRLRSIAKVTAAGIEGTTLFGVETVGGARAWQKFLLELLEASLF
jgi:hypothetical protein